MGSCGRGPVDDYQNAGLLVWGGGSLAPTTLVTEAIRQVDERPGPDSLVDHQPAAVVMHRGLENTHHCQRFSRGALAPDSRRHLAYRQAPQAIPQAPGGNQHQRHKQHQGRLQGQQPPGGLLLALQLALPKALPKAKYGCQQPEEGC